MPTTHPELGKSALGRLDECIALTSPIKGQHGGRETVEQKMVLTILLNTILL
jgi:hypothetical protein